MDSAKAKRKTPLKNEPVCEMVSVHETGEPKDATNQLAPLYEMRR